MRVLLPFAVFLSSFILSTAAETASELASQLLRKVAAAEAETARQKPPATDRANNLRRAADIIHQNNRPDAPADTRVIDQLQELLTNNQDLAKLAGQWSKARIAESTARENAACQEMEKVIRDAAVEMRKAQKPGDLDGPLAKLGTVERTRSSNVGGVPSHEREELAKDIAALREFAHQFQGVFMSEKEGHPREAVEQLRSLFNQTSLPGFSSSELWGMLDEKARKLGVPTIDEANTAVRKIIASAIDATKPAEIDPMIEQINLLNGVWQEVLHFRSSNDRTPTRLAEMGRDFLTKWQDVLAGRAHGHIIEARASIEGLAERAKEEPLYPRAKLLEAASKLAAEPAESDSVGVRSVSGAEEKLAKIKTLDDLVTELPAIKASIEAAPGELSTVAIDLESIAQAYAGLQSGDLDGAKMATFGGFNNHRKVAQLRGQLALQMAAAAFDVKGEQAPHEGEKLNDYVRRLFSDLQKRKDWPRLREMIETANHYPALQSIVNYTDGIGLRSFIAGRNLDAAGVWSAAVESYVAALKSGSAYAPVDEIKDRLEAIRREHPDDFKRGSEKQDPSSTPPAK